MHMMIYTLSVRTTLKVYIIMCMHKMIYTLSVRTTLTSLSIMFVMAFTAAQMEQMKTIVLMFVCLTMVLIQHHRIVSTLAIYATVHVTVSFSNVRLAGVYQVQKSVITLQIAMINQMRICFYVQ